MKLQFKKYNKRYLRSCSELVKTTWKLDEGFENLKNVDLIYKYYLLTCVNYSEHLDIIVDEKDNVKGLLFGSIEDASYMQIIKYKLKSLKLKLWALYHLALGNFGDRKTAVEIKEELNTVDGLGELYADEFDSEINLFIVSPELRGKGYGRKLMDRYVEFCKENEIDNAFLWTDIGCSFSFYEKYGFKLYKKYHNESLTDGDKNKPNGMIYYINIK
ncbi:GNAT family N-acetyltransferase [Clostridium ganghwense]|uniref:GNAT family N-acetyltransferase n=1 Tax=Clostridium ganghwense TaxID=312089 RepID=A0ABT4CQZ5_9CLOT|nr:GNAT family N-acetyltransferase [Clostridium ganghwense]MCY6371480.1 GNAT family N-acetyltransferase [Clostridium ganghwense]